MVWVRLSAAGAVSQNVAHQVVYVVLQIPNDVLDDVSNRDHAHTGMQNQMNKETELTTREILIYASIGLGVWINGAITFRLGSSWLFENGPFVTGSVTIFIALAVCTIFRSAMRWRGTRQTEALTVAVSMLLPGLFCESVRQSMFSWATGLLISTAPRFSAIMFFGNAVLITYALIIERRARASE
jgi:hypothetical protein